MIEWMTRHPIVPTMGGVVIAVLLMGLWDWFNSRLYR